MEGIIPSPTDKRNLTATIERLRARLSPSPGDRVQTAGHLAMMLAAFPAQAQSEGPSSLRADAYFEALDGIPSWATGQAGQLVIRGQAGLDGRFAPTPPQFAMVARREMQAMRNDLAQLDRIAEAVANMAPAIEEKARVVEGFAVLRAIRFPPSPPPTGGPSRGHTR